MVNQDDPRVLRTRQLIRRTFRELLQSKEFEEITVKDIAQTATINRATFYKHYEDKYALLEEITEQAFQEIIPEQVMQAQQFTDEICNQLILLTHNYIVRFYQICKWDSKSIAALVNEKIKQMLQQIIENILLKENNLPADGQHNIKLIAAMTVSTIYGATHYWFKVGENNQTALLVDTVRPYVMNGIGL